MINCAHDGNNVLEIGYLSLDYFNGKYPDDTVVSLVACTIPTSEKLHRYYVDENEPGKFCIKEKSQEDIDTAEAAIQASLDVASKKSLIDALKALPAASESGTVKIILETLQGVL